MANPFTDHPQAVGETYLGHLGEAAAIGGRMIGGGLACVLHGLFPFLFIKTGSNVILGLADKCSQRRTKMAEVDAQPVSAPALARRG